MGTECEKELRPSEYLRQLLKDQTLMKNIECFYKFEQVANLLESEINRVRNELFNLSNEDSEGFYLPTPSGPTVTLQEKILVPVDEFPKYNFVGRMLGPGGNTLKNMEKFTGTKIMVRGKGSLRPEAKVDPKHMEHLKEPLHVLIQVEDARNRAEARLKFAIKQVKKMLIPAPDGEDDLKRSQLMELAIKNGTYRDSKSGAAIGLSPGALAVSSTQTNRLTGQPVAMAQNAAAIHAAASMFRPQNPATLNAFMYPPPRMPSAIPQMPSVSSPNFVSPGLPPLVAPTDPASAYAMQFDYASYGIAPTLLDYGAIEQTAAGGLQKVRRAPTHRDHPYSPRVSLT